MESNTEPVVKAKIKAKLGKDVLNIIRTTMRNSIELTHIADNKANVLLSLNALMLTFLVPLVIPYLDIIKEYKLWIPLLVLVGTCLVTIYITVLVLKPSKFYVGSKEMKNGANLSPFFFGNFYKMTKDEYTDYIKQEVARGESVRNHLAGDLHYLGVRLGHKMHLMRMAFHIFLTGLFISIILSVVLLLTHA